MATAEDLMERASTMIDKYPELACEFCGVHEFVPDGEKKLDEMMADRR